MRGRRRLRRALSALCVGLLAGGSLVGVAVAHGGGFGGGTGRVVTIPTWLVLVTGGAAVGASFLLASFVTDRTLIRLVDDWHRTLPGPGRLLRGVTRLLGVVGLIATVVVGAIGPQATRANLALLFVWVGWWAGYTTTTYLVGNTWRTLNPWRTVTTRLPSLGYDYPTRVGVWPATVALLALIWLEVVSPIADDPRLLVVVVLAYTAVTLTGAVVYGTETWFSRADPVSRVFDHYGRVAPFARDGDGLAVRLPGMGLTEMDVEDWSEVGFVVALLWVTTFDGLVRTQAWASLADGLSDAVPRAVLLPGALLAGYVLFLGGFLAASRVSRRLAGTCLTTGELARQFAPSLLAIAAGYHLAHYLGYFLSLVPTMFAVATSPLSPPGAVPVLALPGWFDFIGMGTILVGHLLAIWVAHATAYDLFPGRLQAIRSQYPFIVVMVFYTMTSLWIIAQPGGVGA